MDYTDLNLLERELSVTKYLISTQCLMLKHMGVVVFWIAVKTPCTLVSSLGVHLDLALTMETQVASVVCSACFHLWRIAQLHPYVDVEALTTLVYALVISTLDYSNALYVGLPLRLWKLQIVQNAAARLLSGVTK